MRPAFNVIVYLSLTVAPGSMSGQAASETAELPRFLHDKQLVASYDSVADSTHLGLVTHKGKYLLWIQRPRLTWTVGYAGRVPGTEPPPMIELVFRTQNPQAAANNLLVIEFASGERVQVTSVAGQSQAGPMVWSHFMHFPIPTADLVNGLAGQTMRLSVGGIRVDFKPDQMEAVRFLLHLVGAWPPPSVTEGGP